ncbi:MAG: LLM class flavin-dependent oxidoreductase [Chloroflexi bacterium]|nr:LLM class flavin-dependent oxidoreductase [Chloroflexota bacterium]
MSTGTLGLVIDGQDSSQVLARVRQAEQLGIGAVWLTTGRAGRDALTLFAAAAVQTERVLLGTAVVPTWPRHPVAVAQQARVVGELAPGRFRLGVGPSHRATMEGIFGVEFQAPLAHLREYLRILRALLHQGEVEFEGRFYQAHARTGVRADVPVMASALRRGSFELCGAEADGAISWVCPAPYLHDVALPALQAGATRAGRPVPPLFAHVPVCLTRNRNEVYAAVREQMGGYPANPFYTQMFADAGFPEAKELKGWSDAMVDAVAVSGTEAAVEDGLRRVLALGAEELLVSVLTVGPDSRAAWDRTVRFLGKVAQRS